MSNATSHGRGKFAERFGMLTAERKQQNAEIIKRVEADGLEGIRLALSLIHHQRRRRHLNGKPAWASESC